VTVHGLDELAEKVGQHLGYTDWLEVAQDRVNGFADATDDHQWIHVDVARAKSGPFGRPIAHGFLTLAMVIRCGTTWSSSAASAWPSTTGSTRCASRHPFRSVRRSDSAPRSPMCGTSPAAWRPSSTWSWSARAARSRRASPKPCTATTSELQAGVQHGSRGLGRVVQCDPLGGDLKLPHAGVVTRGPGFEHRESAGHHTLRAAGVLKSTTLSARCDVPYSVSLDAPYRSGISYVIMTLTPARAHRYSSV
jgi:hypothetical protein